MIILIGLLHIINLKSINSKYLSQQNHFNYYSFVGQLL